MSLQMLLLHFASQGYRVRYTTESSNLAALKQSLSSDMIIDYESKMRKQHAKQPESASSCTFAFEDNVKRLRNASQIHPNGLILNVLQVIYDFFFRQQFITAINLSQSRQSRRNKRPLAESVDIDIKYIVEFRPFRSGPYKTHFTGNNIDKLRQLIQMRVA